MSMNDQDNFIDDSEYSLESILAEYQDENPDSAPERTPIEERSRNIVMEAISDTMNAARVADPPEAPEPETEAGTEPRPRWFSRYGHGRAQSRAEDEPESAPEYVEAPEYGAPPEEIPDEPDAGGDEPGYDPDFGDMPEPETEEITDTGEDAGYASPDYPRDYDPGEEDEEPRRRVTKRDLSEMFLSPIVSLIAVVSAFRRAQAEKKPKEEPAEEIPEVSPKKAGKLYSAQAKPLRSRAMFAFALCAVLAYISYAFGTKMPLLGALKGNTAVAALMCLVIELAVIVVGLDVFTAGIMSIVRLKPGLESLAAVSCVLSVVDAVVVAVKGENAAGLPYCAVSALSMAFALLGSRMFCDGMRMSLKTAVLSKNPFALSAAEDVYNGDQGIIKTRTQLRGFVRRCEEPDMAEDAYRALTPFMLIAAVVLAGLAAIKGKANFFHALSAMTAVSASFSAFLAFPMPFSSVSKRIMSSGAAIAGCSGCVSLGQNARLVITDGDLFPPGPLAIENIRILEGTFTDKVISFTGSLIACSGSGLAPVFTELMSRNACVMHRVEEFSVHEGGGLTGLVKGEQVMAGTSGFMQLMGIRLPQKLSGSTAVFTAINGNLVGVFNLTYTPTASVQDALVSLLQSKADPVFAVRDFNVTPLLIRQKFKMPTEGFDFPSFAKRYEISAVEPDENSEISAVVSREGLGPMVEAADAGRRLYSASRFCTALSVLGSFVGMVLMFFLFASGAAGSYTAANVMSFMLFWVLPVLVVTFGLKK